MDSFDKPAAEYELTGDVVQSQVNEVIRPSSSLSRDDIIFRGKKRGKLSSFALLFGILCILITSFYFTTAMFSVMLTAAPGSSVPAFVFVIFFALPIVVPIVGVVLLVVRHSWVKQLANGVPSSKTRSLLKIILAAGMFFVLFPAMILLLSILYAVITVPIGLLFMTLHFNS